MESSEYLPVFLVARLTQQHHLWFSVSIRLHTVAVTSCVCTTDVKHFPAVQQIPFHSANILFGLELLAYVTLYAA